ncbi:MAG: cytochrome c [Deltaproteobacteria bacterium]|nr:cytochrome c [Deltaproteobacteria bacterium]
MRGWIFGAGLLMLACAPVAAADAPDAAKIWKDKCASCHSATGKGDTKMGSKMKVADMTAAEWQKKHDDAAIKKAVAEGVTREEDGIKKKMKAYKDFKPEEVQALIDFIRALAPKAP